LYSGFFVFYRYLKKENFAEKRKPQINLFGAIAKQRGGCGSFFQVRSQENKTS
jgi:hypothetical protein